MTALETEGGFIRVSGTEKRVCEMIAARQQFGLNKYGQSVEANPLKAVEWLQNLREELADALIYATRLQEQITKGMDNEK